MKKTSKTRKTAAAPSAPAPDLVYTPPRIRAHLDRACAKPVEPPPAPVPDLKEEKNPEKPSDPSGPAPAESGVRPASNGGFDVFIDGKFRGWKKTLPEAEALLKKALARKGLAAVPPAAPPEVQAAPEKSAKEAKKAPEPPPPEAPESPVAFLLVNFSDEAIRAEAERRGLLKAKPPRKPSGDRRTPANREEHAALTKKAWEKARELAAAKGGKPTDHMKEAWAGLVRD